MVQFDNQYRQIKVKIVYYGPALGGKTTSLQHVHRVTDPQRRTKLYSLNTASDRTLFFDLLSLNLGRIRGYRLAIQLYTVPGQVQYNATRRAVLSGADGVVFVADSQVDQRESNSESFDNLRDNLEVNGLNPDVIPMVFLYNKRDLGPLLSTADMEEALNSRGVPSFPSVAITGDGVMEAFAAIVENTLAAVADRLGVGSSEKAVRRLQEQVREALQPFLLEPESEAVADDVEVTTPEGSIETGEVLDEEALVGEAVRANLAMTDLNARLDTIGGQLERKIDVMTGITDFGGSVSRLRDPKAVLRLFLETAVSLLGVRGAAVLVVPRSGPLREAVVHGIDKDPLLATIDEAGEPLAAGMVEEEKPRLIVRELGDTGGGLELAAVDAAGFSSAVVVPMLVQERLLGLLTAYAGGSRPDLDEDDLQLARVLASSAAMAYASAEAWAELEDLNSDLEAKVDERTVELRASLDRIRDLAKDLHGKTQLLEEANRELSELDHLKANFIERISSELKKPVNSVVTAARLLSEQPSDASNRDDRFVSIIREEAEKLNQLIASMIQASSLAYAGSPTVRQEVGVEDLLRKAIAPLRDIAQQRGLRLNILIPSGLKTMLVDPDSTETAVRAVIANAIAFSRDQGAVKLEVRRVSRDDEPWLVMKVIDTGVGIADKDLDRVFDSFWQGENAPGEGPRGFGLGLTIAKRILEAHGGMITVESRVDEGTGVTLSFPQTVE
jgi:signal transduction histidine kinase/signal recognition particle receptor subunit beta